MMLYLHVLHFFFPMIGCLIEWRMRRYSMRVVVFGLFCIVSHSWYDREIFHSTCMEFNQIMSERLLLWL